MESLRGKLLVSAKHLRDPNFFKTAVLMLEHNEEAAMGLVINRPSSVTVATALCEHFNLPKTEDVIFVGGPVEPAALCILHNSGEYADGEIPFIDGIHIGSSAETFEEVVNAATKPGSEIEYRIFSGYAGWGPHQLECEIARGDWYVVPCCPEHLFKCDTYTIFETLMDRVYQRNRLFEVPAERVEWN